VQQTRVARPNGGATATDRRYYDRHTDMVEVDQAGDAESKAATLNSRLQFQLQCLEVRASLSDGSSRERRLGGSVASVTACSPRGRESSTFSLSNPVAQRCMTVEQLTTVIAVT